MSAPPHDLRTVIADDEPLARERLRRLLASTGGIEIVAECRNGNEVVAALKTIPADLLFLDIQMPGKNGFEVIAEIGRPNMPVTIFVTAHNDHAVEAFDVNALDYLVKPVEPKRLDAAVTRARERVRLEGALASHEEFSSALEALRAAVGGDSYPRRFLTKNGSTASVVAVDDLEWIEAADYYVCLHAKGKQHLLRESIKALEEKLNPGKFVRVHRSAIVNIDHVREIHKEGRNEGWVLLSTGARVRMNRTGWQKLLAMNSRS
jgi:two-component system, LytTR family, response regulator